MFIRFAEHAAWRALYVYAGKRQEISPRVLFSLGIDPTIRANRAEVFGQVGRWRWRFALPRSRHWWRLDGRRRYLKRKESAT